MAEPTFQPSVFDRLLKERIIWLGSEVRDDNSNEIAAKLLLLAADDPKKDIYLYINSPGGSITAGMAIYDTMQYVPNDIVTVGIGMAASMGQLLLTAGTKGKRYITPNARVLLHQPHGGFGGTSSDIQTQAVDAFADRTGDPTFRSLRTRRSRAASAAHRRWHASTAAQLGGRDQRDRIPVRLGRKRVHVPGALRARSRPGRSRDRARAAALGERPGGRRRLGRAVLADQSRQRGDAGGIRAGGCRHRMGQPAGVRQDGRSRVPRRRAPGGRLAQVRGDREDRHGPSCPATPPFRSTSGSTAARPGSAGCWRTSLARALTRPPTGRAPGRRSRVSAPPRPATAKARSGTPTGPGAGHGCAPSPHGTGDRPGSPASPRGSPDGPAAVRAGRVAADGCSRDPSRASSRRVCPLLTMPTGSRTPFGRCALHRDRSGSRCS